jgi:hypothetical protein
MDPITSREQSALALADRYVAAWDGSDADLRSLFAADAVITDELRSKTWVVDELLAAPRAMLDPGPWPRVFVYDDGDLVEAIALVQTAGDCPVLEARRWLLDDDSIVAEQRYAHVPSVRRCDASFPGGWWDTFVLPPDLQDNVTELLDVGGMTVDLVNAEPVQERFARWLFDRFAAAGIGYPAARAIWFSPAPECIVGRAGLAVESDARYEDRHTAVVCYPFDRIASDSSGSGWSTAATALGLHELAHLWMLDHLSDDTRSAFDELGGFEVWREGAAEWRDRGVEHAATTIAWGLAGTQDARYPILPPPTCDQLSQRFRLLTGRTPLTQCGENGWSAQ